MQQIRPIVIAFHPTSSAQSFFATYAAVYKIYNFQRSIIRRPTLRLLRAEADRVWVAATVAV